MENKKIPPKRQMPAINKNPEHNNVSSGVSVAPKPMPPKMPPKPVNAGVASQPVPPKMPPKMPPKPKQEVKPVEEIKSEEYFESENLENVQATNTDEIQQENQPNPVEQQNVEDNQELKQDVAEDQTTSEPQKEAEQHSEEPKKNVKKEKVQKEKEPKEKKQKPEKIQKPEKETKAKPQKQSKPKVNKKKLPKKVKMIIFASVFAVIAIAGVIIFFALQPKPEKLATPVISVHKLSNQTFLYVEENKNAEYYEFYIQKIGDTDVKYIKSETNEVNLLSFFKTKEELGEYEVWARYGSKNELIVSDESEREVCKYTKTLETPKIEYKSNDNTKIVWLPVANATAYYVYYGAKTNEYFRVTTSSSTSLVEFNLYEFDTKNLAAGNYTLQVQAIGNSLYYENSELSNMLEYTHKITLSPVTTAIFSKATKVLTVTLDATKTPTQTYEITIIFAEKSEVFVFDSVLANTITFDLKLAIDNSGYTVDDIRTMSIKAIGENEFVTNSTSKTATIN